jgi:hypothetical protein
MHSRLQGELSVRPDQQYSVARYFAGSSLAPRIVKILNLGRRIQVSAAILNFSDDVLDRQFTVRLS